jgi:nitrate reductase assembly molybdenum cofactor insertion protein NarJ
MNKVSDPELFSFSVRLIEKNGGLIEQRSDYLLTLLPEHLAHSLELPEEVRLGGEGVPLLYGSPLLDHLIHLATGEVPIVYGHVEIPYLKKAGFEQLIGQDLSFIDGQTHLVSRAEARTSYMVLVCHYVALSDERKEGLIQVGVHEASGALIADLEERLSEFQLQFFEPGKVPPHFPVHLEQALSCALKSARTRTQTELSDFFSSMRRRLRRDVRNTREYYEALKKEMEESLGHPHLTEAQRQERMAKIRELPREMSNKVADLEHKYQVQVTLTGCAALRFILPMVQIMVGINYRKLQRTARATWNPITRRLDPMVCERCQGTIRTVYLREKDFQILLLCSSCSARS